MTSDEHRYTEQLERFGALVEALDLPVSVVHVDDANPLPGLRIHIGDPAAELVCLYTPIGDVDDLSDLDLLTVVLSRNEQVGERRAAVESVLLAVNEACPVGHFGVRDTGEIYYRLEWPCPHGGLPDITAFADTLKLVSYADVALRPSLLEVLAGAEPDAVIADLRA